MCILASTSRAALSVGTAACLDPRDGEAENREYPGFLPCYSLQDSSPWDVLPMLTGPGLPHPVHAGDSVTETPRLCFIGEVPWVFPDSSRLAMQLAGRAVASAVWVRARCLLWGVDSGGGPLKEPPGYGVPFPRISGTDHLLPCAFFLT